MRRHLPLLIVAATLLAAPVSRAEFNWSIVPNIPAVELTDLLVSGDTLYVASPLAIYRHPVGTSDWFVSDSIAGAEISAVAVFNGRLYAGTFQHGVYESTNGGASWTPRSTGLSGLGSLIISCLEVRGDSLYVGTSGAGVWMLAKGATTWVPFRDGLGSLVAWDVGNLTAVGDWLFCGAGQSANLFFVAPGQSQWTNVEFYPFIGGGVYMSAFGGTVDTLFGAGSNGLYIGVDSGLTWTRTPGPFNPANRGAIVVSNGRVFGLLSFAGHGSYVYEYANGVWAEHDYQAAFTVDLVAAGTGIYAARLDGLFHAPTQPTDVGDTPPTIPLVVTLHQNYPNPFNPTTVIAYELEHPATVELAVYDVIGRHVTTLHSGRQNAGSHAIEWNGTDRTGSKVASGTYFYRLKANDQVVSRRMTLVK